MTGKKDNLFATDTAPLEFRFDERVADVFEDMINRSVPGYATIVAMTGLLARQYCKPGTRVYDLGSSLGASALAVHGQVPHHDYCLVAVDNSPAMAERLRENLGRLQKPGPEIEVHCADLMDISIRNASVVVLNFTLQFIPLEQRARLLSTICQGMVPGGILVLSEKIKYADPELDALFVDAYHSFKEKMGYSRLEISRKRNALEKVLLPQTLEEHRQRCRDAGFQTVDAWFRCFNFASLVAIK